MSLENSAQAGHANQPQGAGHSLPETVGVLVNYPLETEFIRAIEAVDPRIRVMRAMEPQNEEIVARGGGNWDDLDGWRTVSQSEIDAFLAQADIYGGFGFQVEWLDRAPRLKWLQLSSAGSDHMLRAGLFEKRPDLIVTTASGVHEVPISEHILAMILHFSRKFNVAVRNQPLHKWARYRLSEASGATVCIIGYGSIGRRATRLCNALGMKVTSVRASLKEQEAGDDMVERFYPLSDLDRALSEADYVVVAAPRTPQSEKMIGRQQLAAMKPGAVLVNISRGALVDEAALVEALREGKLSGAGLDVFEQEPLPESSPLWDFPNVLITPHNSGATPYYNRRLTEIFCDNLARYLSGQPLRNKVEPERGY
jgi:phosphoglycerate dehydrogenase-like enzyme